MALHRLVTLGDSLTQGLASGAVCDPGHAWPAVVADALGLSAKQFRYPRFLTEGGLPLNLEWLIRKLEDKYGPDLSYWDLARAPCRLRSWMDDVEDFWEGQDGPPIAPADGPYHNLASFGMTVDDGLYLTAGECARQVALERSDNLIGQVPEQAFFRLALAVLNPTGNPANHHHTAVSRAIELGQQGGVENLVVALGANNALGTITQLSLRPSDDRVLTAPEDSRRRFNLWRGEHFAVLWERLALELEKVQAERVFLATVPHVTIAPLARGVGTDRAARLDDDPRYFRYYTYFWIADANFEPDEHPHLTGEQAIAIDAQIDTYNAAIRYSAAQRVARGLNWHVVDLCDTLNRLAFRRYREIGLEPPGGAFVFPPSWLAALRLIELPELTTQFFKTDQARLLRGGIFSLDGIHPTSMGQGLLAMEFLRAFAAAGVPLAQPPISAVDFPKLLAGDLLVSQPPAVLDDVVAVLHWLEEWAGLTGLLRKLA